MTGHRRAGLTGVVTVLLVTGLTGCGSAPHPAPTPVGSVWSWGEDYYGQLGKPGSWESSELYLPAVIPDLSNVVSLAAGTGAFYAVDADGVVWASGLDWHGELGVPPKHDPGGKAVRAVEGLPAVRLVATDKSYLPIEHPDGQPAIDAIAASFAVDLSGQLWGWGGDRYCQMTTPDRQTVTNPTRIPAMTGVAAVTSVYGSVFAVKTDGSVWAWGNNDHRQVEDGDNPDSCDPQPIPGLTGVTMVDGDIEGAV